MASKIDKRLSALFKRERKRQGMTVQALADKVGMKRQSVESYEAGVTQWRVTVAILFSDALKLNMVIKVDKEAFR